MPYFLYDIKCIVMSYSLLFLHDCRIQCVNTTCGLSPSLCQHLSSLNLLRQECLQHEKPKPVSRQRYHKRWRKRGRRAGRSHIKVIIGNRQNLTGAVHTETRYNSQNLIPIELLDTSTPIQSHELPRTSSAIDLNKVYTAKHLNVHIWNARSVRNKTISICDYIIEYEPDILFFTETWLRSDEQVIIGELTPPGYTFMNSPRDGYTHSGGIGIVFKDEMKLTKVTVDFTSNTFEHICVTDCTKNIRFVTVYRPPPSQENGFTTSGFLSEFEDFLETVTLLQGKLLLVGDYNIHMDCIYKSEVSRFTNILSAYGLKQHVEGPTHKRGHTLDLVISNPEDNIIHECKVQDEVLSDHYFIQCTLKWRKPQPQRVKVTRRNYRDLNMSSFVQDVEEGLRQFPTDGSVDLQVETLSRTILEVLNKQCPLKSSLRRVCSSPPWYNTEIHEARRSKRRMERKYRKNKTDANKQLYLDEKKTFNDMLVTAKTEYFINKLASTDPKGMFATVNTLLNKASTILPDTVSPKQLSDDFADFFSNKIKNIRKNMDNGNDSSANICSRDWISESTLSGDSLPKFDQLTSVSEDCVLELIQKMPSKSCILDPLPTWLLKDNITLFLPYLTSIVSTSLTSGVFPASYCSAVVSPIIKKHNLDKNCLQNYRPVSNLQFGAKVVEKAAISQISEHINSNNLFDPNQSAYRRQHSTETALLRVKSDIMCQIDQGNAVMLVMLDLSAAFDTIDHTILLHRLQCRFAITDTALSWITTYMTDRSSKVSINGHFSADHDLIYGVPQGSVVGPNLFVY